MSDRRFIERGKDESDVKQIDCGIKNSFKWTWMEHLVDGHMLGQWFRKIRVPGKAYCTLCQKEVNYASRGRKALEAHVSMGVHSSKLKEIRTNYSLPGSYLSAPNPNSAGGSQYGIHPMFRKASNPVPAPTPKILVSDRAVNAEAMVLGFIAEKSLPFSIAPDLIGLTKELARNQQALNRLSIDCTSASIKMRLGLAETIKSDLITCMKTSPFSLNIDEATSSNFHKILCVLVSYYSPVSKKIVVEHLKSVSLIKVNSESVFNAIATVIDMHEIPWSNLMSVLMDSCNIMRGSKTGERAPHLLDIDGDTCHHAQNAAKSFCKPFEYVVEGMLNDLHNDFRWSPDLREACEEICNIVGVKYHMPDRYVSHRWLSVYDVTVSTLTIMDALVLHYYSFLSKEEKVVNQAVVVEVFQRKNVSEAARDRVRVVQLSLSKKAMTKEGKERKDRILDKLFRQRKSTILVMGLYSAVLPLLKQYVMFFQMTEPLVHLLNEKQTELLREFLACFIKPEVLSANKMAKQLSILNVKEEENRLPQSQMFIGMKAANIVKSTSMKSHGVINTFLNAAESAYIKCAETLQTKMPINNQVLKCVATLDPTSRGHSLSQKYMLRLPALVSNVLTEEEIDIYDREVRSFHTCLENKLPKINEQRIDHWWVQVKEERKYPVLSNMGLALLTCFHCPQVESAFSTMGDILDTNSSRTNVKTFSAVMSVKYHLKANDKIVVQCYRKADFLHDYVL